MTASLMDHETETLGAPAPGLLLQSAGGQVRSLYGTSVCSRVPYVGDEQRDADEAAEAGRKSTMIEHPNPIHKPFVRTGAACGDEGALDSLEPTRGPRPRLPPAAGAPAGEEGGAPARAARARALPRTAVRACARRARTRRPPPRAAAARQVLRAVRLRARAGARVRVQPCRRRNGRPTNDGTALIYQLNDSHLGYDEPRVIQHSDRSTKCIEFSPNGRWLAVGGASTRPRGTQTIAGYIGKISLYDVQNDFCPAIALQETENTVFSCAFSACSCYLACAGYGQPLRVWQVATGLGGTLLGEPDECFEFYARTKEQRRRPENWESIKSSPFSLCGSASLGLSQRGKLTVVKATKPNDWHEKGGLLSRFRGSRPARTPAGSPSGRLDGRPCRFIATRARAAGAFCRYVRRAMNMFFSLCPRSQTARYRGRAQGDDGHLVLRHR